MKSIADKLSLITPFEEDEKQIINSKFSFLTVKSKTKLVNIGEKTNSLYFIIQGCIRKYCIKDGNPITLLIAQEGEFALEYVSFMNEGKSENVLETVEDCTLLEIKKEELEALYIKIPKMNFIMRKVLEQVIYKTHLLLNGFISMSPEERYLDLIKNNPSAIARVPQHIIASYLGISPTSLSRIRKRILKKS